MLSTRNDRSGIDQQTIDNITQKYRLGESGVNGEKTVRGSSVGVHGHKTKKKNTTTKKPSKKGASTSPTKTEPSARTQGERTKAASANAQLESSSLSSSTSSSDEDLAMYESKTAMSAPHSANGEDGVQNGGCRAPSPAEQTEGTGAKQNIQQHTGDIQILPSSVDHETTTKLLGGGSIKPQEEAVAANSHVLDFSSESQQWPVERVSSFLTLS